MGCKCVILGVCLQRNAEAELLWQMYIYKKRRLIDSLRSKLYLGGKYSFSWYESNIASILLILNITFSCFHGTLFLLKLCFILQGGKTRIYAHIVNLKPFLPKFHVILVNSGTSQYNVEEKFHVLMKFRRIWDLILHVSLPFFYFKSLKRKNTSFYRTSIQLDI